MFNYFNYEKVKSALKRSSVNNEVSEITSNEEVDEIQRSKELYDEAKREYLRTSFSIARTPEEIRRRDQARERFSKAQKAYVDLHNKNYRNSCSCPNFNGRRSAESDSGCDNFGSDSSSGCCPSP